MRRDEDRVRRDVAVDDGDRVRVVERAGDLLADLDRLRQRQRPVPLALAQEPADGLAGDEFHGDEGQALFLAGVVDPHDVRVVELAAGARGGDEPVFRTRIAGHRGREDLQGDRALHGDLRGAVHAADVVAPEQPFDAAAADDRSEQALVLALQLELVPCIA